MSRRIKGIMVSRLIVLLSIFIVPILVFLIFAFAPFQLAWIPDEQIRFTLLKIIIPLVFSLSWVYFLLLFSNRIANSIDMMDKTTGVVPLRLKFFYGINALFVLGIFIYPLITPIVSVLSFASFAWRLTTFRKEEWGAHEKTSTLTKIAIIIAIILPIICGIIIIPEFITLGIFLWSNIWVPLLEYLYIISKALVTALTFGSLIILFKTSGISEFEQFYTNPDDRNFLISVKVFDFFFFLFLLFLEFFQIPLISIFYYAGFVIVIFVALVNLIKGRMENKSFKSYIFGYLLAIIFMGSSLLTYELSSYIELGTTLKTLSLIISAITFILILFIAFLKLEDINK
jgi:hypothetical protein